MFEELAEPILLFSELKVEIDVVKEVFEGHFLVEVDDVVDGPVWEHVFELLDELTQEQPLAVQMVGLDPDL